MSSIICVEVGSATCKHHFCHILLAQTSHKTSPDSNWGNKSYFLMGRWQSHVANGLGYREGNNGDSFTENLPQEVQKATVAAQEESPVDLVQSLYPSQISEQICPHPSASTRRSGKVYATVFSGLCLLLVGIMGILPFACPHYLIFYKRNTCIPSGIKKASPRLRRQPRIRRG